MTAGFVARLLAAAGDGLLDDGRDERVPAGMANPGVACRGEAIPGPQWQIGDCSRLREPATLRIFLDTTEAIRYVELLSNTVISGHLDGIDVIYAGESRWPKIL
jgi:hypothetical protein